MSHPGNAHGVGHTAEFANPQWQIKRLEALFPDATAISSGKGHSLWLIM